MRGVSGCPMSGRNLPHVGPVGVGGVGWHQCYLKTSMIEHRTHDTKCTQVPMLSLFCSAKRTHCHLPKRSGDVHTFVVASATILLTIAQNVGGFVSIRLDTRKLLPQPAAALGLERDGLALGVIAAQLRALLLSVSLYILVAWGNQASLWKELTTHRLWFRDSWICKHCCALEP